MNSLQNLPKSQRSDKMPSGRRVTNAGPSIQKARVYQKKLCIYKTEYFKDALVSKKIHVRMGMTFVYSQRKNVQRNVIV